MVSNTRFYNSHIKFTLNCGSLPWRAMKETRKGNIGDHFVFARHIKFSKKSVQLTYMCKEGD